MSAPRVSVVIPTYNGKHLLEILLPSLAEQRFDDYRAIVVDDGSTDGTATWLAEHWPEVEVVVNPQTTGVAAALNRGVEYADGELIALLNNDIELDPGWLGELVAAIDTGERLGSVACKLLSFRERDVIDGAGDIFRRNGTAFRRGHGERDRGQFEQEEAVFAPTAGAGVYRAAVFAEIGGFDESFYAYLEDADWGLRAQLAGYSCRYVPSAVGYHVGSATTNVTRNPFFYGLLRRNVIGVIVKDMPLSLIARNAWVIVRAQLGGLLDSARAGMLRVHLLALGRALGMLPRWLRARRRIQRARRVSAAELAAILSD